MRELLEPGTEVDRYRVEAWIAEGSMGAVYRVRHSTLGTQHALKLLYLAHGSFRRRFELEAQVQARLSHPHVVRVTDVILYNGNPGLIAEFVNGPDLGVLLENERLSLAEAVGLFREIVDGVCAAHAAGVVHRDLKPQNILTERVNGVRIARVSDFGIASTLRQDTDEAPLTRLGVAMGTPGFMAPEQYQCAASVDHRADIFSLGCILYEMLLQKRAFPGADIVKKGMDGAQEKYEHPQAVDPSLPDCLSQVIVDCLRGKPELRVQSAALLLARIDDAAAELGLEPARPAPPRAAPVAESVPETWASRVPSDPSSSPSMEHEARDYRVRRGPYYAAAACSVIALGAWLAWPEPEPDTAAPPPVQSASMELPAEPEMQAEAQATGSGAEPTPTVPEAASKAPPAEPSSSRPARTVEAPSEPSPAPVAAAGTTVRFEGEHRSAALVGDSGRFGSGGVPAGRYVIRARFAEGPEVDAGYVSIREGEQVQVSCSSSFEQCRRVN